MPQYKISHTTAYYYEDLVSLSYNEGHLLARSCLLPLFEQECNSSTLSIEPLWNDHRERVDFFGNQVTYFTLRQPHQQMVLTAKSNVTITPAFAAGTTSQAILAELTKKSDGMSWERAVLSLRSDSADAATAEALLEARQFVLLSTYIDTFPALLAFARTSFPPGRPLLEAAAELMTRIYEEFDFVSGATTIATPLAEVLEKRKGVCQDFAHLMIACLRSQGLAARYMSGYIETVPPPGQEKLEGSDASHAWCALYAPTVGWVDFDPTNNLIPQEQHVILGWGRDFSDVTPLKGVFFGDGRHTLEVAVDMRRIG